MIPLVFMGESVSWRRAIQERCKYRVIPIDDEVFHVCRAGAASRTYDVVLTKDLRGSCSCPRFQFHGIDENQPCIHLWMVYRDHLLAAV